MIENLKKRDNESEFEFGLRVIEGKVNKELDLDWDEIVDLLGLDCHKDSLRKSCNVGEYNAVTVHNYYKNKIEELILNVKSESANDILDEIELKKMELYKERIKLQDQRRNYMSLVRTEARWESMMEMIKDGIEAMPFVELHKNEENCKVEASLLLSDWHIGSEINTVHNVFNLEVAKERVSKLVSYTLKQCKLNGVKRLNIELCGDLISGIIHITTRLNNSENAVAQTVLCSELISNMINELSKEMSIVIHYTIGNHGRISSSVKESLDSENFEYLILEFIKLRLANNENVVFNSSNVDKEVVTYDVFGKTIAIAHGHREKKMFDSVKELSSFLGIQIDEVHMGHFHNFSVKNNVIVNGCLSGADEYSNNMRFNNKPSQTLIIHSDDGTQVLHNIILN